MVVAELHGPVDVLRAGHVLFEHADRLESDRDAETRGREAGAVAHDDRLLAHLPGHRAHFIDRGVRSSLPAYDLDELHEMRRIEEVKPDESIAALDASGKLRDRD